MSSTAAAKVAKVPPSSFAVLLRRSKFASYDSQIGQIYTTFGGSASRGDWGLKRPLAVRRRDGRLLVSNIDTLYQQTEWTSAYSDAMTVRKFEEVGVTPTIEPDGNWAPRINARSTFVGRPTWLKDSDYTKSSPSKVEKDLEMNAPVPDPRTMGPKRLERYLRKVRRLQPEFEEFIEGKRRQKTIHGTPSDPKKQSLYALARGDTRDHTWFLSDKLTETCKAENSTVIRPMPHVTAGLTYAYSNELQSAVTGKPLPGRRLRYIGTKETLTNCPVNVAFAGWTAKEIVSVRMDDERAVMTDFGTQDEPRQNSEAGKQLFRPTLSTGFALISPPEVVGKYPQRLDEAVIKLQVASWAGAEKSHSNSHKPGTVEYITHREGHHQRPANFQTYVRNAKSSFTMTDTRRKPTQVEKRVEPRSPREASRLLDTLRNMVKGVKTISSQGESNDLKGGGKLP